MTTDLKQTPLYDQHVRLGARRAPFAGYDMPVFYRGIYEEAAAVRTACGVFDVSHMARLQFKSGDAAFLQKLLTCDVSKIQAGTGSYALVLNVEGGILDDVILYRKPDGKFLLVVNAANREKISKWILHLGGGFSDLTDGTAMLAVQGPKAEGILGGEVGPALRDMAYFSGREMEWKGMGEIWICRTGYTGEDGYEIISPAGVSEKIWKWLMETGNVVPCGLGARDVLRIEAGYSLYGSDMDESASPYECGLGFAVSAGMPCVGAAALKNRPVRRRLVGLDAGDQPSAILRHGYPILAAGRPVGHVTSGVFSKTLSRSIGFGSIDAGVAEDAPLTVEVRNRAIGVQRVSRRFIQGRVKTRK